jgi:hypothetical protein
MTYRKEVALESDAQDSSNTRLLSYLVPEDLVSSMVAAGLVDRMGGPKYQTEAFDRRSIRTFLQIRRR